MRNIQIKLIVLFCLLFLARTGFSQESKYRFHKVFFYNFTKYIEWPANYQDGDFVMAVYGDSEITDLLKEMAEIKKAGTQTIKIITVDKNKLNQKINLLFLPEKQSSDFDRIKSVLSNKPTLLITETEGLARQGAMINFKDVEGKLKFEINTPAINQSGLKVSSELARFGEEVK